MAWLNEIRSSNNAVLRRDSGFATQDAAKIGGRKENEKPRLRLKARDFGGQARPPDRPDVGRIMVGQDAGKPTRY